MSETRETPSATEPTIPGFCLHSKFVRGCPSCTYRWLKHHGYVKPSRVFNHYSGLNRLREMWPRG